jgi:hypothetical protein
MFQFPAFASYTLCIQGKIPYDNAWKLEVFQPVYSPLNPRRISGDGLAACIAIPLSK